MFFTEGFYGHDDALYGAARLLRIVADAGPASRDARYGPQVRLDARDSRRLSRRAQFDVVDAAVTDFALWHDVVSVDGARVLYGDGWGLIRASNTQPVLVLALRGAHRRAAGRDPG